MNLDIIKPFLTIPFVENKMVIDYDMKGILLWVICSDGTCPTFRINDLKRKQLLNLPETIINLLSSRSNIQHILAFNLISLLDPNKKYELR